MRRTAPGPLASLAIAVFAVSWAAIFVRKCVSPPPTIAFWRVGFASLVLLPLAWRDGPANLAPRRPADRRAWATALVAGVLLALHFALWFESLRHTTVASATVLVATQPLFAAIAAPLLVGERTTRRTYGAIALALVGVGAIGGADAVAGLDDLGGDLLALASAVFSAVYLVLGRRLRERIPFFRYLLVVNASAAVFLALYRGLLGYSLAFPARDLPWLLGLALVPHLLGHGFYNFAVRRLRATLVNLTILGEPVLATLWAALLFGERPGPSLLVGALLVFAGVALALRENRRTA